MYCYGYLVLQFPIKKSDMKKIKLPEKKAGIWLDQEKAYIIKITGNSYPAIEKIRSEVESRIRVAGEVKVSARFGNAFLDDQEKKQRRQGHQRHRYFNKIIESIPDVNYIYLFGPSETRHELNNEIEKNHILKDRVVAIKSADRMTQEQMVRVVLNFFDSDEFRNFKKSLRKQKAMN
jgi:mannosyltransferase OCH1-like enzyme